jgi:hypothetical protein
MNKECQRTSSPVCPFFCRGKTDFVNLPFYPLLGKEGTQGRSAFGMQRGTLSVELAGRKTQEQIIIEAD